MVRPTKLQKHGRLRAEAGCLRDRDGAPVTLRGVSLFWSQWIPKYFNRDTLRWLRDDWAIDVVRAPLAVHHGGYLEHPAEELEKVHAVVSAAIDLGLYVIVDWHAHEPETDAAAHALCEITRFYGPCPNILYETWNEPAAGYEWPMIKQHHLGVASAIRAHDPDCLIIAGTPHWSQHVDIAGADPLPIPNVAYALHFYAGTHRSELRRAVAAALDHGATLLVTEWGVCEATGDGRIDLREARTWMQFLEARRIGHINWSISDKVESAAALAPGASSRGDWTDLELTESGRFVRWLLKRNASSRASAHEKPDV
jgi:endoglucanase